MGMVEGPTLTLPIPRLASVQVVGVKGTLYNLSYAPCLLLPPLQGIAFFQSFAEGTEAVWWTLSPGGRFGIFPGEPPAAAGSGDHPTHLCLAHMPRVMQTSWDRGYGACMCKCFLGSSRAPF